MQILLLAFELTSPQCAPIPHLLNGLRNSNHQLFEFLQGSVVGWDQSLWRWKRGQAGDESLLALGHFRSTELRMSGRMGIPWVSAVREIKFQTATGDENSLSNYPQ